MIDTQKHYWEIKYETKDQWCRKCACYRMKKSVGCFGDWFDMTCYLFSYSLGPTHFYCPGYCTGHAK